MWFPEAQVRVWLHTAPTDMRKSYNGLSALVRMKLAEDPLSGQLFVFVNRRHTQMKILYFDGGGYCLWCKRLEQGQFHSGRTHGLKRRLNLSELKLIIDGIDTRSIKQFKRFRDPIPWAVAV